MAFENDWKINLEEFRKLSIEEQYRIAFTKGNFLTSLKDGNGKKAIYEVSKFYVEVSYDSQKNKVTDITSFNDGALLTKYARFISDDLEKY